MREGQPPVCDICPGSAGLPPKVLLKGKVPVVHGVFVVSKKSSRTILSPFALCAECQAAMNIKPGDIAVPLDRFKDRWLEGLGPPESYDIYLVGD